MVPSCARVRETQITASSIYNEQLLAPSGETDDLVMAALLAVRMLQQLQNYHQELSGQLRDHSDMIIEPMPFIALF